MVAWPKVVMVETEQTGEELFGEVESTGLAERLEGVGNTKRKELKTTSYFWLS